MALQNSNEAEPGAFLWGLWAYLHEAINSWYTLLLCHFFTSGLTTIVQTLHKVSG